MSLSSLMGRSSQGAPVHLSYRRLDHRGAVLRLSLRRSTAAGHSLVPRQARVQQLSSSGLWSAFSSSRPSDAALCGRVTDDAVANAPLFKAVCALGGVLYLAGSMPGSRRAEPDDCRVGASVYRFRREPIRHGFVSGRSHRSVRRDRNVDVLDRHRIFGASAWAPIGMTLYQRTVCKLPLSLASLRLWSPRHRVPDGLRHAGGQRSRLRVIGQSGARGSA